MWLQVIAVVLALLALTGCTNAKPIVRTEVVQVEAGQTFISHEDGRPSVKSPQSGFVFIHSTTFPQQERSSDLSGVRKVYIFVPEKYLEIGRGDSVEISKKEGLIAFEYSRNDASPEKYCFQPLSKGVVSIQKNSVSEIVLKSRIESSIPDQPSDARCGMSTFFDSTIYKLSDVQ